MPQPWADVIAGSPCASRTVLTTSNDKRLIPHSCSKFLLGLSNCLIGTQLQSQNSSVLDLINWPPLSCVFRSSLLPQNYIINQN